MPTVVAILVAALVGAAARGSGDPLRPEQWWLDALNLDTAWDVTTGTGVTVAVIDTGIWVEHPDLRAASFRTGNTFVDVDPATGHCIEGCGRGRWGEFSADATGPQSLEHGTSVASILAAQPDNDTGMVGVAPGVTLLPVRVVSPDDRVSLAWIAAAVDWAVGAGADVINLSLAQAHGFEFVNRPPRGLLDPGSAAAIERALAAGVAVVAGAGNTPGYPFCQYPASIAGVLCVTGMGRDGVPSLANATFPNEDVLAVAAPDAAATSLAKAAAPEFCSELLWFAAIPALWGALDGNENVRLWCPGRDEDHHYTGGGGTSFASPMVAGVVALAMSVGCDARTAVTLVTRHARYPGAPVAGVYAPTHGYGLVDADATIDDAVATCGAGPG